MEEEIKKLNLEIEVLKERISSLERIEQKRKIKSIIKFIVTFVITIIILLIVYELYTRVVEIYNSFPIFF